MELSQERVAVHGGPPGEDNIIYGSAERTAIYQSDFFIGGNEKTSSAAWLQIDTMTFLFSELFSLIFY